MEGHQSQIVMGLHYQSPNENIFLEGYFHFSTIDILGQIILSCRGLSCMLSDVWQYPWPLPSRCQVSLLPIMNIKMCKDFDSCSLSEEKRVTLAEKH